MQKLIANSSAAEYFALHHQAARIQKRLEELKAEILPQLIDGAVTSNELPFMLVNRPQNRKQSDWKGACFTLLKKYLKSPARAEAQLEKIDASFEVKPIPALHVAINPAFVQSTVHADLQTSAKTA